MVPNEPGAPPPGGPPERQPHRHADDRPDDQERHRGAVTAGDEGDDAGDSADQAEQSRGPGRPQGSGPRVGLVRNSV